MVSVTAFGAGSEPKLLLAGSSFQVPTLDAFAAFVCANAEKDANVRAATTRAHIFIRKLLFVCADYVPSFC
jgi:hypothetical protein